MPISEALAMDIAREEARRRGWPWQEPFQVKCSPLFSRYSIMTSTASRGGNVLIEIDGHTGAVLAARYFDH